MIRKTRYASRSQVDNRRQSFATDPPVQNDGGRMLADGNYVSMRMRQAAVEEARQKMQMKYSKDAELAAEKKKQRELRKREAWLARQEALVTPGLVLGRGRAAERNLLCDYVECQYEDESQQDTNKTEQSWMHQQYNALVQQRMERGREAAQLQRRQEQSKEVKLTGQGAVMRPGTVSGSGLPNQTSDYFLGTGYVATSSISSHIGLSNQAVVTSTGYVLGTSSVVTSPRSHSYGFAIRPTVTSSGHVLGAVSAESTSHVVGMNNAATSPKSDSCVQDVQAHHRKEMLAARRKLQEQYDAQIKQAAEAKEQEEKGITERLECSSLN